MSLDLLTLTPTERQIYALIAQRPRTVDQLIAEIWWIHPQDAPGRATVKAHIWALNRKLRRHYQAARHDGEAYKLISTVKSDPRSKYMREYMRRYRSKMGGQDGQPQSARLDDGAARGTPKPVGARMVRRADSGKTRNYPIIGHGQGGQDGPAKDKEARTAALGG